MNTAVMEGVDSQLRDLFEARLSPEGYIWLSTQAAGLRSEPQTGQLGRVFAQVPRFASKAIIAAKGMPVQAINEKSSGYDLREWTVDTICRVWLLLQLPTRDESRYVKTIEALFSGAEVNELVALYKALPLLQFPEAWVKCCEEGIRSNMGNVLEAIMYENPYPANYLSEAAWNQMVLKAFFTEKDVSRIYGLEERINPALRATLADYVQERLAAGRSVNPGLYKLMEA